MEMTATKATFPKYPAYEDSGEYWMAEIPEHWEIKKLKHVFHEKKKVTNPDLNCGSISYGKVVYKDDEKIPESTKASYQEVLAGEFLINPLNLNYDLVSLRIGLSEINVVVSSGYIVLKNSIDINKSYFNYLLHRYDVAYMKLLGSGVRQTINFNHISNSLLAFPPPEEQTAIANFLDDKTAKIDRAIAQKEKMIALLKERKQIIIQNAVTKGLDPNAKMKDSGVEWIGEVPEGWRLTPNKSLFKLIKNQVGKNSSKYDLLSLTLRGIIKRDIDNPEGKFPADFDTYQEVKKGDFVFCLFDVEETPRTVGLSEYDGMITGAYTVLRNFKEVNNTFLYYFYLNLDSRKELKYLYKGLRNTIPKDSFFSFKSLIPPWNEQNAIVNYIESQSAKIEKAIALQEQQIEKLKELKSTLIDSAVTGKIKVS